jgi:hydroxymethylpyrimidine/phosphomethylpyrimidine kinase
MKKYSRALTIAGSDSGGGAGIQADLKVFAALGCFGSSCITALTAQNTTRVDGIFPIPASFVAAQMSAVLSDIGSDAIKVGMLFDEDIIEVVQRALSGYTVVLDPVMVAKSGDFLLQEKAASALVTKLFPLATIVTPNLDEAAIILGHPITDMEKACQELLQLGSKAVLLKGGHLTGDACNDLLMTQEGATKWFNSKRIITNNTHGTGCSLSSAITAFLARGFVLEEAVAAAKEYLTGALQSGSSYTLGSGHGPIHHFYRYWL